MTLGGLGKALFISIALMLAAPSAAQDVSVCLITKTDSNPFFVKMRDGARAKAISSLCCASDATDRFPPERFRPEILRREDDGSKPRPSPCTVSTVWTKE